MAKWAEADISLRTKLQKTTTDTTTQTQDWVFPGGQIFLLMQRQTAAIIRKL